MKVTLTALCVLFLTVPETCASNHRRAKNSSKKGDKGGMQDSSVECPEEAIGQLYSSSNAASGNELLAFCRFEDGSLSFGGSLSTTEGIGGSAGGLDEDGTPDSGTVLDPLGSNHPVVVHNNKCVLVTNAGSDSVSTFSMDTTDHSVRFAEEYASLGLFPVSIATSAVTGTVFVLNAGGEGNVATFFIDEEDCSLTAIDEPRVLSFDGTNPPFFATSPASIRVHPSETALILTQKGKLQSLIVVFPFSIDGLLKAALYTQSEGYQPFSIAFDAGGNVLITEENGLATLPPAIVDPPANAGAVSTYRLDPLLGGLEPISSSVPTNQTAPCWSVYTDNCLFVANVVSGTIGSYQVNSDGSVDLIEEAAGTVDGSLDLFVRGEYLYALSAIERIVPRPEEGPVFRPEPSIYTFKLQPECGLEPVGRIFNGLPDISATGGNGVVGLEGY